MNETALQTEIRKHVARALERGKQPNNLYREIITEIEKPMFDEALINSRGNQTKAAINLGVYRGFLRERLKKHGMIK